MQTLNQWTVTEKAQKVIAAVAETRSPREIVVLVGGGCCDGTQAQLVDKSVLNPYNDACLGDLMPGVKLYLSVGSEKFLREMHLTLDVKELPPNYCSDSFSMEIPLGFQLVLSREALDETGSAPGEVTLTCV